MIARIRDQWTRTASAVAFGIAVLAASAAPALAHLERPSYWPDPGPDKSVKPAAGGEVPDARSLKSAVTGKGPGDVLVVCKGRGGETSLDELKTSIRGARTDGFRLRPSQPEIHYSRAKARRLMSWNRTFARDCEYHEIQAAVNDAGNNDRVVIMPGRYTEATSRRAPVNDPRCNPSMLQQDQSGANTPSYEYQSKCPNDQNLVYVQGRAVKGAPLPEPDPDRHGIPKQEHGLCIRCNLQMEGSGVKPEDVIIDAGKGYENPRKPGAKPADYAKHVVLRTDRSDGFVGRNFTVRGAQEHGFYTEETDGVLLDKVKFFWAADYGHLSFTSDHNVVKNCDGFGAGDAVVYPGAAPQTGDFRHLGFYPKQRNNTVIKRCDLHGSALGYSGSMGNSVRITRNHIYGNSTGITSDTLSSAGHPGFPSDGIQIDRNHIYSNNLNLYRDDAPIDILVPAQVGAGFIYLGVNDGNAYKNWIFDNWLVGAVVVAVPDQAAGDPEGNVDPDIHCSLSVIASTSCGNRYHDNVLGQVPKGFKWPTAIQKFGNAYGGENGERVLPNGTDFFWDEFAGNEGNCWYDNEGPDGTEDSVTAFPGVPPDDLPSDCSSSMGLGDPVKELMVIDCATWERGHTDDEHPFCPGFEMPARPGTAAARAQKRDQLRAAQEQARTPEGRALADQLDEIAAQSDSAQSR